MIVLVLLVSASFAKEKVHKNHRKRPAHTELSCTPFLLIEAKASPESDMHVVKPQEDSVQSMMLMENLMRPPNLHRTGTGIFMVGMIGDVTGVAIPVQQFIYLHSSFDSGANQFSRPAVHVQPNIRRGSEWMSVQLRL
jgi:hypothetical protein